MLSCWELWWLTISVTGSDQEFYPICTYLSLHIEQDDGRQARARPQPDPTISLGSERALHCQCLGSWWPWKSLCALNLQIFCFLSFYFQISIWKTLYISVQVIPVQDWMIPPVAKKFEFNLSRSLKNDSFFQVFQLEKASFQGKITCILGS